MFVVTGPQLLSHCASYGRSPRYRRSGAEVMVKAGRAAALAAGFSRFVVGRLRTGAGAFGGLMVNVAVPPRSGMITAADATKLLVVSSISVRMRIRTLDDKDFATFPHSFKRQPPIEPTLPVTPTAS